MAKRKKKLNSEIMDKLEQQLRLRDHNELLDILMKQLSSAHNEGAVDVVSFTKCLEKGQVYHPFSYIDPYRGDKHINTIMKTVSMAPTFPNEG